MSRSRRGFGLEPGHTTLLGVTAALSGLASWWWLNDLVLSLNVALLGIMILARVNQWPRADWFGKSTVIQKRDAWGRLPIGVQVSGESICRQLTSSVPVDRFFEARQSASLSEKLANDIVSGLSGRIMLLILGVLFTIIMDVRQGHLASAGGVKPDAIITLLKQIGGVASITFLVTWEGSRIDRQTNANRSVAAPDP